MVCYFFNYEFYFIVSPFMLERTSLSLIEIVQHHLVLSFHNVTHEKNT